MNKNQKQNLRMQIQAHSIFKKLLSITILFFRKYKTKTKIYQVHDSIIIEKGTQSNLNVSIDEIKSALQKKENCKGQELDITIVDYKSRIRKDG